MQELRPEDGTVSVVAEALIGTGSPLDIIPTKTANAFAVALGIPALLPVRNAYQAILAEQTQTVDAAYCNSVPIILLADIGYEANVIETADRALKNQWGTLAYLIAGWHMIDQQEEFDDHKSALKSGGGWGTDWPNADRIRMYSKGANRARSGSVELVTNICLMIAD